MSVLAFMLGAAVAFIISRLHIEWLQHASRLWYPQCCWHGCVIVANPLLQAVVVLLVYCRLI
jgi:hypothetical protein